jgi:hypothetical protein
MYSLACGTSPRSASSSAAVYGVYPSIMLTATSSQIRAGASFSLSWSGSGAGGACTPSGGSGADGWPNIVGLVSNGSWPVTENTAGTYTYTITCTGGGQSASSSTTVTVTGDAPASSLTAIYPQQQIYTDTTTAGAAFDLLWAANENFCTISWRPNSSGAAVQAWSVSGSPGGAFADAETAPGPVTYTLQCGNVASTATINWVTTPTPVPNGMALTTKSWATGIAYPISWNASTGPCTGSGGGLGDGWAGSKAQAGTQSLSESQPGTYVFSLTCGSGSAATTGEIVAVVPLPFIQIYALGSNIAWQSTVGPCTYVDGSSGTSTADPVPPTGSATAHPSASGIYLFTLTCGSGAGTISTATIAQIDVQAPTTLSASVSSTPVSGPVTLTWSGPPGSLCVTSGGNGTPPWAGTLPGTSGSVIVTSRNPGTVNYVISCNASSAQVAVTYTAVPSGDAAAPAPTVSLSTSASSVAEGQSVSLTWRSQNATGCAASGGASGDGWTGTLAPTGTMSVTETTMGTVSYSISCAGAPPAATAMATVVVTAPAAGSTGGGGALDLAFLLGLGLSLAVRIAARRRHSC